MSVVCVDTQLLYWAIMGRGTDDQQLLDSARDFMKMLDANGDRIIVPSIVVGEMLVPVEEWHVKQVMNQYKTYWRIADYDIRCALQFAVMRRNHALEKRVKSLQELEGATRKELIADVMIIATAIANSADIIYSNDGKLRTLAEDWIEAKDFVQDGVQYSMNLKEKDDEPE